MLLILILISTIITLIVVQITSDRQDCRHQNDVIHLVRKPIFQVFAVTLHVYLATKRTLRYGLELCLATSILTFRFFLSFQKSYFHQTSDASSSCICVESGGGAAAPSPRLVLHYIGGSREGGNFHSDIGGVSEGGVAMKSKSLVSYPF